MKKYLLLLYLLPALCTSAQVNTGNPTSRILEIYGIDGKLVTSKDKEVKGDPWFNENWGLGYVKFTSGKFLKNASLRFSLLNNELHYKLTDIEFSFVDPISEFSFSYEENGSSKFVLFRNGYPGNNPGSRQLFYEVLYEGTRFQLLKHHKKNIEDTYEYGAAPLLIFRRSSELYMYDKQVQSLVQVKNKRSLAEAFPELAVEIGHTAGNKNGKFRSEKELADVLARVNQ